MKNKKIIWFKRNPSPDDKAIAKAQGLIIRDPAVCHGHDFVEHCDAVCGDVPQSYGHYEVVDLPVAEGEQVDGPTREEMKAFLTGKGVEFPANIPTAKLAELYATAKAE